MRSGTKFLFILSLFFLFLWILLHWFLPFAFPFLLGTVLALSAEPMVKLLCQKLHFPRGAGSGVGVSLAFLLLSALILGIIALLFRELQALGTVLPDLEQAALSGLSLLRDWLLSLAERTPGTLRPLLRQQVTLLFSDSTAFLKKGAQYVLGLAGGMLTQVPDQAFTLFTGIVSGFMISAKLPKIRQFLKEKFSRQSFQAVLRFFSRIRRAVGGWLIAQLKLAGVTLMVLTLGLILLKIPYAPVWALGITLLDILPVLGTGTVLIPWGVISLLQGSTPRALGLFGIYATVSLLRSVLEPRFLGRQLGLDPLVTLAALYTGYRLWGFGGMILSPLLAVAAFQLIPQEKNQGKSL